MVWAALIPAAAGLLGGAMQASSTRRAAQTAADAQTAAAQAAAEEARFRPVGVTTRFGTSAFQYNPEGRVSGATYQLSPAMQAYQDRLQALADQGLLQAEMAPQQVAGFAPAAERLFQLGERYLAETPEQVAQQYMQRQLDLLAPSRERQYAQLQNQLFQTGRGGLSVGATGMRPGGGAGLGASNPELEAYYNALAQQDAALAAEAQQRGQQQLGFGSTLFGTGAGLLGQQQQAQMGALAPFSGYLGGISNLESLGQQPLTLGASLGGGNTASAQALLSGGLQAAQTMYPVNAMNPTASFLQGLGSQANYGNLAQSIGDLFSNFSFPGSAPQAAPIGSLSYRGVGGGAPMYLPSIWGA